MSSSVKSYSFAVLVGAVCCGLLLMSALILKPLQERHARLDRQKYILKTIGLINEQYTYSNADIKKLYADTITERWLTPTGAFSSTPTKKPLYIFEKNGVVQAYAVPISGKGLWNRMYGYIALRGDGSTIQGLTIYSHKETPGLGGNIEKPWFQDQFKGKKIIDEDGIFVSVSVIKKNKFTTEPTPPAADKVDGISGATNTSKGVEMMIRRELSFYEFFSRKLRDHVRPKQLEPLLEEGPSYATENFLETGELPASDNIVQQTLLSNFRNWTKGSTPTKNMSPTQNTGQPKTITPVKSGYVSPSQASTPAPQTPLAAPLQDKSVMPEKAKSGFRFFNRTKPAVPTKSTEEPTRAVPELPKKAIEPVHVAPPKEVTQTEVIVQPKAQEQSAEAPENDAPYNEGLDQ